MALFILLVAVSGQQGCYGECSSNSDCVKTQVTCCPCNMGGREQCIPFMLSSLYRDKLKKCPSEDQLVCAAIYNCEIKNCSCVNGNCVEVKK